MKKIWLVLDEDEHAMAAFVDARNARNWMKENGFHLLAFMDLDEEIAPEQLELPGIPPF